MEKPAAGDQASEWYSVWVLPPEDVRARLKRLMADLRSEFGGPELEPHITVVGTIRLRPEDAARCLRSACAASPLIVPASPPPPAVPSSTSASRRPRVGAPYHRGRRHPPSPGRCRPLSPLRLHRLSPYRARVASAACGTFFYQSVYLLIDPSPEARFSSQKSMREKAATVAEVRREKLSGSKTKVGKGGSGSTVSSAICSLSLFLTGHVACFSYF